MEDRTTMTEDDEGKRVTTATGEDVGRVMEVRGGTAYVEPDPGLTDSIRSTLGWGEADEDTYPIREDRVGTITDDEIRLSQ